MTTLMLTAPQRNLIRDKGTTIGRILMGLLFLASGLSMLFIQGPSNVAGYFENSGLPMAGVLVWLVIVLKVVAGSAIILGKRVGLAAGALIAFTLLATLIAHMDFSDPMQMTQALKNLAIVGGLLYVMAYGKGGTQ